LLYQGEREVKKIQVASCELRFVEVKKLRNMEKVTVQVIAPTRVYEVVYYVDDATLEVLATNPMTLHREMRDIHDHWRENGVMKKVFVPLMLHQKLMGFDPAKSYRRFFLVPIWKEEVK